MGVCLSMLTLELVLNYIIMKSNISFSSRCKPIALRLPIRCSFSKGLEVVMNTGQSLCAELVRQLVWHFVYSPSWFAEGVGHSSEDAQQARDSVGLAHQTYKLMCPDSFTGGMGWWGKDAWYGYKVGLTPPIQNLPM